LLSFGHDIELLPNDKLQIWDLLWFFWSTSSNQADFRQLHQIGKLPELLPRAKSNGCKTGGLEWDLLPVDFLR
jgi:hypothetical protein